MKFQVIERDDRATLKGIEWEKEENKDTESSE